ncbi:unnamed protein product [Lepeophtheirus salmonis]|uniref:(salmon louse) hypothetical protein n=1 Tax=Lepeophtheirus salmonis TaxID=72036 RepID=A0A7R8CQM6_LEPSM|nr:unnamed protein product [Lepeophtheirus salmonis]CAF2860462.1 unnamed protein product [Lepeophtheirus salmonis]
MNLKVSSSLILLGYAIATLAAPAEDVKKRDIPLNSYGIGSASGSYSNNNALSNFGLWKAQVTLTMLFSQRMVFRQQAVGKTKVVGDTEVVVMKGSMNMWVLMHNICCGLDVPIPYPEIADAVAAQIAYAATNPNDYDDGSYNGNSKSNQVYIDRAISSYGLNK